MRRSPVAFVFRYTAQAPVLASRSCVTVSARLRTCHRRLPKAERHADVVHVVLFPGAKQTTPSPASRESLANSRKEKGSYVPDPSDQTQKWNDVTYVVRQQRSSSGGCGPGANTAQAAPSSGYNHYSGWRLMSQGAEHSFEEDREHEQQFANPECAPDLINVAPSTWCELTRTCALWLVTQIQIQTSSVCGVALLAYCK